MNNKIESAINELDLLMYKVSRVHGKNHLELIKINELYPILKNDIINNDYIKANEVLNKIKILSNNFNLPSDACSAYTRVYNAFKILGFELNK